MKPGKPASALPSRRIFFLAALLAGSAATAFGQESGPLLESGIESIHASDITSSSATFTWRREGETRQWQVTASFDAYDVDFVPNALSAGISRPASLSEDRRGVDLSLTQSLSPRWEGTLSANVMEGFSDFRALWISEYYRQLFSGFSAYTNPDPGSHGASAALVWEAVPQNVFLDLTFGGSQERTAPGYERIIGPGGGLEKDEELLNAWFATLGAEHFLSPRIRYRHELAFTTITGRDNRFSYRGQLNWAIADEWVSRSEFSHLREGSEFYAWSVGSSIERDWNERWFAGLSLRFYKDNGQLENALFTVTSAAPPLQSYRLTASLRYVSERFSLFLYAGPYVSDYGDPGDDIAPFANLYQDRDWVHAGIRLAVPF